MADSATEELDQPSAEELAADDAMDEAFALDDDEPAPLDPRETSPVELPGESRAEVEARDAFTFEDEDEPAGETQPNVDAGEAAPVQDAGAPDANLAPDVLQLINQKIDQLAGVIPKLEHRLSTAEGRLKVAQSGGQAAQAARAAGGEAPTQAQIDKAVAGGGPKWTSLKKDWPDWAEALEERLGEVPAPAPQQIDLAEFRSQVVQQVHAMQDEALQHMRVELKHEGWKETINSAEFQTYLENLAPIVPSRAEIAAIKQSFFVDRDHAAGNARVQKLIAAYPEWAANGGALRFSGEPADAIKLLDGFHEHRTQRAPALARTQSSTRLRSAVQPKSRGGATPQQLSAEDQMEVGFQQVRR